MISFELNGQAVQSGAEDDTPLLWVIRDELGLMGTKFGCGIGLCGACTVHIDGTAQRACSITLGQVSERRVTTIEGLHDQGRHPLQIAWVEAQVPQCGYCQSGQIMQAASLLQTNPAPSKDQITAHMSGNLCRCMSYTRIHKAIVQAASSMEAEGSQGGAA